jgi:hypothetical protein
MSPIWLYKGYVDSYLFPKPLLCYDNCNRVQIYNLSAEKPLSNEGDDRTGIATTAATNYRTGSAGT